MEKLNLDKSIKPDIMSIDMPTIIVNYMKMMARQQMPELENLFPFQNHHKGYTAFGDGMVCVKIINGFTDALRSLFHMKDERLINYSKQIIKTNRFPSFNYLRSELNDNDFNFGTFTYIGPYENEKISSKHLFITIIDWINTMVFPIILQRNTKRVTLAIPQPPSYSTDYVNYVMSNIYILENEKDCVQGTAFHLKGIGLITCDHVLTKRGKTEIFSSKKITKRFPIKVIKANKTIDLAIIEANGLPLNEGLEIGNCDEIKQMMHIATIGYPNYKLGDSGIFSPGLIIGFRMVSSIRRLLVNTPIVAGNSGGPVINRKGQVIGVAVTGADRAVFGEETEHYGVAPINALNLI